MKHDLEAFSREIVSLIKTSGDTGDSGDKLKKSLPHSDFFVPTHRAVVSPLESDWGHGITASGDRKSEHLQLVAGDVPSVPTATTQFQAGLTAEIEDGAPPEWHAILAELEQQDPVDWLPAERWIALLSDGENFLSDWGCVAHALGWTAHDLFGVHPAAPATRFDVMGLLPILNGAAVLTLSDTTATMRRASNAVLTYRRSVQAGAILLSELRP